ncbi:hypothetical protein CYMTET_33883 [Cymbomonas tetramitiformis]|uniref:NHL repeat containing protein n=1 Tax=Cymbomonas tetramitiformis TaxID=36881 RepID=A0AAE0KQR5_9CHLO|nr:hypothetical protein CYMTET_33883 [Cymbomonas tetramitiformis]
MSFFTSRAWLIIFVFTNCVVTVTFGETSGVVKTLAGRSGVSGAADGKGTMATFNRPEAVAVTSDALYVADTNNHLIRRVDLASGNVTTLAGQTGLPLCLYESDTVCTDGIGTHATFSLPGAIVATEDESTLYISDHDYEETNGWIRKVDVATQNVTTLAGAAVSTKVTERGLFDGTGTAAQFTNPIGLVLAPGGSHLYVVDYFEGYDAGVRRVEVSTGVVTTLAGGSREGLGTQDGTGTWVRFSRPKGACITADGKYLFVADRGTLADGRLLPLIRRVNVAEEPSAVVTLDWNPAADSGESYAPYGVALESDDSELLFSDENSRVWAMETGLVEDPAAPGPGAMRLLAGATSAGAADGTGTAAQFRTPLGVALSSDGLTLYLADSGSHTVRSVSTVNPEWDRGEVSLKENWTLDDEINGVAVDYWGNAFVTGYRRTDSLNTQMFTQKVNGLGSLVWDFSLQGSNDVTRYSAGSSVAVSNVSDHQGDVFVVGSFTGQWTLNTVEQGEVALRSTQGRTRDMFVIKLSYMGTARWASTGGGDASDVARGVAVHESSDTVMVVGQFNSDEFTFRHGTAAVDDPVILTNTVSDVEDAEEGETAEAFILKLSAATGEFRWGMQSEGDLDESAAAVVMDGAGAGYVSGMMQSHNCKFGDILVRPERWVCNNTGTYGNQQCAQMFGTRDDDFSDDVLFLKVICYFCGSFSPSPCCPPYPILLLLFSSPLRALFPLLPRPFPLLLPATPTHTRHTT